MALVFRGFPPDFNREFYTFQLNSDDGARLFVGITAQCISTRLERAATLPDSAKSGAGARWSEAIASGFFVGGKVTFASRRGEQLELEMMDRDQPVSVLIASGAERRPSPLAQQRGRCPASASWRRRQARGSLCREWRN